MKNPVELRAFATHLRRIREERGLSQQQLADMANISRFTILRIENEQYGATLDNMVSIAKALDMPLKELVGFKVKGSNA